MRQLLGSPDYEKDREKLFKDLDTLIKVFLK